MSEVNEKVCPECGASMGEIDPEGHALTHWVEYLDPAKSSGEARKRQKQVLTGGVTVSEYRKSHEVK